MRPGETWLFTETGSGGGRWREKPHPGRGRHTWSSLRFEQRPETGCLSDFPQKRQHQGATCGAPAACQTLQAAPLQLLTEERPGEGAGGAPTWSQTQGQVCGERSFLPLASLGARKPNKDDRMTRLPPGLTEADRDPSRVMAAA